MHEIELRHLDLNLLVVLHALLQEGGVTAAAERLHLSPSATSHALGRLRQTFDDPLLVREGNKMVPTPRAVTLQADLASVLHDVQRLVVAQPAFDPGETQRLFCIAASDVVGALIGDLVAALRAQAPGVSLRLIPHLIDTQMLATGVDLALQPLALAPPSCSSRHLGALEFVVVARLGHPILEEPTVDAWCQADHVQVDTGRPGPSIVGAMAERAGLERRVALWVPGFVSALQIVSKTDLIFTAPLALVSPLCEPFGLATAPLALAIPRVPVGVVWHPRFDADAAHQWLRECVFETLMPMLV